MQDFSIPPRIREGGLKENVLSNKPPNWDFNSNDKAIEVVNESGGPIFQLYYKTPSHIVINGIFQYQNALLSG